MNKRNLPIKLFEKRKEIDDRRVEGSGSNEDPKWVLPKQLLKERSTEFKSVLDDTIHSFNNRESERGAVPATLSLELDMNAIAKGHRPRIKEIFNVNYKSNVIGFSDQNKVLVKVDSPEDAKVIGNNLSNYAKHRIGLSAITSVNDFEPLVEVDYELGKTLKVSLINYQELELNNMVERIFENFCTQKEFKYERLNYTPELIIYKIVDAEPALLDSISEFEAVESISFMPEYSVTLDGFAEGDELEVKIPDPNLDYPIVGVLDSGIAKNDFLSPWIVDDRYTAFPDELIDNGHGTFVSGVLLYGDQLEGVSHTGLDGCMLYDATVFPKSGESISEDMLVENIREAVKSRPDIHIWNMSLGSKTESDLHEVSHFGQALDNIQESYNVVICKSAGNCTNFIKGLPKSRISKSADSIHALVVGSIAHDKSENDEADINDPSPFTRIGKGPSGIIKPELVSYGGNAHYNGKLVKNGVKSLSPDGQVVTEVGTSFSTPRVTALLAALQMNMNEEFNPLLLKALAVHSAQYPECSIPQKDRIIQMGFGLPSAIDEIIYNDEHEITLILQDTLIKGEFMEIMEFPFPQSLIDENGHFYGIVNLTLVSLPVLRKQGGETCQSNLDVKFGTYDELKERDTRKPNILNEIGPDGASNVLREALYAARFKKSRDDSFSKERMLINYNQKYHPVKKYTVNLEEMTPANRNNFLKSPKDWYLRVRGYYRDFAEEEANAENKELNQDFALVITIKDPRREAQVYNEVTQLLSNGNFNHSNIKIRSTVRVDTGNSSVGD